jgi:hypothetical protein
MVNEGLSGTGRRPRDSKRKALIFKHNLLPRRRREIDPDQDAADLANPEPRRFNRFASPPVHNET